MDPIRRQLKGLLHEPENEAEFDAYAKVCEVLESDNLFFTNWRGG